jgi:hypothetical protein
MITVSASITLPSSAFAIKGRFDRSISVINPQRTSVSKRSACFFRSSIISTPPVPSGYPGKLSTSVVVVSCPPGCSPWYIMGLRSARAAYMAAVYPAGPDPMIRHLVFSVVSIMFYDIYKLLLNRCCICIYLPEVSSQNSEFRSFDKITYFPLTRGLIRQCRKVCQKADVFYLQQFPCFDEDDFL